MLDMEKYQMKLNILGEEWEVKIDPNLKDDFRGLCDISVRTITLNDFNKYLKFEYPLKDMENEIERTLRHEIVHAIFSEAGLEGYSSDELLVDFLSVQIPKLEKIIEQVKLNIKSKEGLEDEEISK